MKRGAAIPRKLGPRGRGPEPDGATTVVSCGRGAGPEGMKRGAAIPRKLGPPGRGPEPDGATTVVSCGRGAGPEGMKRGAAIPRKLGPPGRGPEPDGATTVVSCGRGAGPEGMKRGAAIPRELGIGPAVITLGTRTTIQTNHRRYYKSPSFGHLALPYRLPSDPVCLSPREARRRTFAKLRCRLSA